MTHAAPGDRQRAHALGKMDLEPNGSKYAGAAESLGCMQARNPGDRLTHMRFGRPPEPRPGSGLPACMEGPLDAAKRKGASAQAERPTSLGRRTSMMLNQQAGDYPSEPGGVIAATSLQAERAPPETSPLGGRLLFAGARG